LEVFDELNVPIPSNSGYTISPKEYSRFFRVLYNATFLNHDMSERALGLLVQSKFDSGLAAGVPAGTDIANKFGESGVTEDGRVTALELHDCGIIYFPQNPYFLCVMTRGTKRSDLETSIQAISRTTYNQIRISNTTHS